MCAHPEYSTTEEGLCFASVPHERHVPGPVSKLTFFSVLDSSGSLHVPAILFAFVDFQSSTFLSLWRIELHFLFLTFRHWVTRKRLLSRLSYQELC